VGQPDRSLGGDQPSGLAGDLVGLDTVRLGIDARDGGVARVHHPHRVPLHGHRARQSPNPDSCDDSSGAGVQPPYPARVVVPEVGERDPHAPRPRDDAGRSAEWVAAQPEARRHPPAPQFDPDQPRGREGVGVRTTGRSRRPQRVIAGGDEHPVLGDPLERAGRKRPRLDAGNAAARGVIGAATRHVQTRGIEHELAGACVDPDANRLRAAGPEGGELACGAKGSQDAIEQHLRGALAAVEAMQGGDVAGPVLVPQEPNVVGEVGADVLGDARRWGKQPSPAAEPRRARVLRHALGRPPDDEVEVLVGMTPPVVGGVADVDDRLVCDERGAKRAWPERKVMAIGAGKARGTGEGMARPPLCPATGHDDGIGDGDQSDRGRRASRERRRLVASRLALSASPQRTGARGHHPCNQNGCDHSPARPIRPAASGAPARRATPQAGGPRLGPAGSRSLSRRRPPPCLSLARRRRPGRRGGRRAAAAAAPAR